MSKPSKIFLRLFFIITLLTTHLLAIDAALLNDKIEIGPGISSRQSVYDNQGITTVVVPIIVITYGDFYTEGDKAAYIFYDTSLGETTVWTEAIAMYRQQGFLDAKAPLDDLEDRKDSIEMGLALSLASENFGIVNLSLVYDTINTHKGHEFAIKYEAPIVIGDWIVRPVLNVQYMSQNLANYYFGVSSSEVIVGRDAYSIQTATNYSLGYDLKYLLTDRWRITQSLDLTKLDTTITESPLVTKGTNIQFSIALIYDFL